MQTIHIRGGHTLSGSIRPAGAKNSVLPLLAASLLCGGTVVLHGVPRLSDVDTSLALLRAVGANPDRCGDTVTLRAVPDTALTGHIPASLAGAMRSSVFYLAPLLCRTGCVELPLPGGCRLGPRPVDIHLAGLTAMGAQAVLTGRAIVLRRRAVLHGVDFTLRLPSVGATLTLMMAATQADGTTVLRGAACEPEIEDVACFLRAAGACIHGTGTPVITIRGGSSLGGAVFSPLPDRIAATTYAAAVACAGGQITIEACRPALLGEFLALLRATGCEVTAGEQGVTVGRDPARRLHGGHSLCTGGWPGFATDAAPLAAALLLTADAPSEIYDAMFQ
ncbi:MAG: UDP-N-acetylglucosamine 1-carboxyvinyltransferase, partial [Gemmiger sp.]